MGKTVSTNAAHCRGDSRYICHHEEPGVVVNRFILDIGTSHHSLAYTLGNILD